LSDGDNFLFPNLIDLFLLGLGNPIICPIGCIDEHRVVQHLEGAQVLEDLIIMHDCQIESELDVRLINGVEDGLTDFLIVS
jgi:hypothetical protein